MTVQLDNLAREINVRLTRKDRSEDHRLAAGLLLRQAKEQIPHGQWGSWVAANINRSRGDVIRLMALAEGHEPEPPSITLPCEAYPTDTDGRDGEDVLNCLLAQEKAFRNMAKTFNELAGMMAIARRVAAAGAGWGAERGTTDTAVQTADSARQIARNMLVNFINNTDFIANPQAVLSEDRRKRLRTRGDGTALGAPHRDQPKLKAADVA